MAAAADPSGIFVGRNSNAPSFFLQALPSGPQDEGEEWWHIIFSPRLSRSPRRPWHFRPRPRRSCSAAAAGLGAAWAAASAERWAARLAIRRDRSTEERRVVKEFVRTSRLRRSPYQYNKKPTKSNTRKQT